MITRVAIFALPHQRHSPEDVDAFNIKFNRSQQNQNVQTLILNVP